MAATTLVYKSLLGIRNITKGLFSLNEGVNKSNSYTAKINKELNNNTNLKKKSIISDSILYKRKLESVRRKKQEGIIELSKVGSFLKAPGRAISDVGQGILSRIMNVTGTLMAGWLIYNLPTITGMAQELTARVIRLTQILGTFIPNITSGFFAFGDLIGAYGQNFINFDFTDSQGRVEDAMKNLQNSFSGMSIEFDEVVKLITTPLTEPLQGPGAPPFNTDYEDGQQPPPSSENQKRASYGTREQRAMLDAIAWAEGGVSYKTMFGGGQFDTSNGWRHPDKVVRSGGYASAAAGRYQFMPNTWARAANALGLKDFSPINQDRAAIWLMDQRLRGNSAEILKREGTSNRVLNALSGEWAAVPMAGGGSFYGQRSKRVQDFKNHYQHYLNAPYIPPQPQSARPLSSPEPSPTQPGGGLKLIPQTGSGGFIQGKTGKGTGTHFHLDDKRGNYTPEVLANIREVAFRAIKAMQARGSTVFLTNYSQINPASKNDSVLRSQILQDQNIHGLRSTPGVDIQEQNPNIRPTYPGWPGSATKFPYAVGVVKWRGGYGNEAEIIGSGGITVSHGAEGSTASKISPSQPSVPTQIQARPKSSTQNMIYQPEQPQSYVVPFIYPQQQNNQSSPAVIFSQPQSFVIDNSLNSFIDKKILLDLAYT